MGKYKNIKKVGLAIICFEGTEHLYNIISTLRDSVDYVSLGLQRLSYHGDKISEIDLQEIYRLRDEDKILDKIVEIELDTTQLARVQETEKRNILIQDAEDNGCSHVIVIDSDEYYTKKSFEKALQEIDDNDYEMTYCQYVNYYHDYKHYLKYPFERGMYVPFVSKTKYRHQFECTDFNMPSDPTRRYVRPYDKITKAKNSKGEIVDVKHYTVDYHIFDWNTVKMHHLSWLRADIRKKLYSWSSKKLFKDYETLIDKAVDCFNHFDESNDKSEALMLFNTPDNKVDVTAFPRQYINPPVDYNTRLRPVKDPKKIIFLSMSCADNLFEELDECCNETWRNYDKVKYPNINAEFWTYTDAEEGKKTWVDEKNHKIYIERDYSFDEPVCMTYSKTLEAFMYIKEHCEYDYIVRTNTSTWLNVPLINEFLSYVQDDSIFYAGQIYSAFWSAFNIYGGGQLMLFSKRQVNILLELSGGLEFAKKQERELYCADDNLIYSKFNARMIHNNIHTADKYHSLGGLDFIHAEIDESKVDFAASEIQIKTYFGGTRKEYDIKKMLQIDEMWRKNTESIESLYKRMMNEFYDKEFVLIPYSKKEYFSLEAEKNVALKFQPQCRYSREEGLRLAQEYQKKHGYKPAKF